MKRRFTHAPFLLLLALIMTQGITRAGADPLPEAINLRSPTRAFNERHFFAVEDGLIYAKERTHNSEWQVLGNTGHPENIIGAPVTSDPITEISVDGPILIAVSDTRRIYYCTNGYATPAKIAWTDHWGTPLGIGKGISLPENIRGWALSQDDLSRNKFYADQNGNTYPCMVTSIFCLSENGQEIHFTDPWTPPDWGYRIAGPFRDRFISENISAAASTLFVINRFGDMYTHQNDFDMGGGNPFFNYTFEDGIAYATNDPILNFTLARKRKVPDQIWYNQPKIHTAGAGRITRNITLIFPENGKPGESDRILRVQGLNAEGAPGYYEKNLEGVLWAFVSTPGAFIDEKEFIDNPPENMAPFTLGTAPEYTFSGTMKNILFGHVEAELSRFSLVASPAEIKLKTESGTWVTFKLHHHLTLRSTVREHPGEDGDFLKLKGAIEIPEALLNSPDPGIQKLLRRYFYLRTGTQGQYVNVTIKAKTDAVDIRATSLSMRMNF